MEPRDAIRLREMIDAARDALEISAGKSRADLDLEKVLALALTRCLEIVGEAASRVSPKTRDSLVTVQWRKIRQMRNILVHEYSAVDYDIVWQTLREDLPGLIGALEEALPPPR